MVMFPYIQFVKRHRRQLNTKMHKESSQLEPLNSIERGICFRVRAYIQTHISLLWAMRFLLINANSNSKRVK